MIKNHGQTRFFVCVEEELKEQTHSNSIEILIRDESNIGSEESKHEKIRVNVQEDIQEPEVKASRILLVDDNEFNSFTLQQIILMSYGHGSDLASDGKIAVDMVKERLQNPYKLIFMDCQMPIMDGF